MTRLLSIVLLALFACIPTAAQKFDFDGDGRTDISIFRPSDSYWYQQLSGGGYRFTNWGTSTDKIIAADHDNDGKTDIGVFRNGVWFIIQSASGTIRIFTYGEVGDTPLTGDFDGDHVTDFALRRVQSNGHPVRIAAWGGPPMSNYHTYSVDLNEPGAAKALSGDFDGNGTDDIGYFFAGGWATRNPNVPGSPVKYFEWGAAGDIPVPADYDGDGRIDYAVYRPSDGTWWIRFLSGAHASIQFGQSGDIPVPGDYDGDGKTDIAIYRDGQWWQYRSAEGLHVDNWGAAGDRPIPAQAQF